MKKTITILFASLLTLMLASCGGESASNTNDTTAENPTETTVSQGDDTIPELTEKIEGEKTAAPVEKSTYDCKLDCGVTVTVGEKAADILAAVEKKLGNHTDFMEAPSCVHPGKDKVYTFDGFTLTSSPDANGDEFISDISFTSDAVGFESGVMIGSSAGDITAAFGDKFTEAFGVRKYTEGNVTITITFDGDAVSALSVSSAF